MSTYTPIATQTLGTATSSVIFSSIPQGYTDLVLVISAKNSVGQNYETWLRFNEDSTSSYSQTFLQNYGGSTQAGRNANITEIRPGKMNTTSFDANIIHINSYSNSTTYKTTLSLHNNAEFVTGAMVGTWRNTNAITRIDAICESGANYTSGSTFTLYGIQTGNRLAKADGGTTVTTDGSYWYHTFKTSGAFIPKQALTVDYLVVAGGGGGASGSGNADCGSSAGGGGGYRTFTSASLTSETPYIVTIGSGGVGAASIAGGNNGTKGSTSTFLTNSATGGGNGVSVGQVGVTGGSGGGGGADTPGKAGGSGNQGSYSPSEGSNGGVGGTNSGGGGGGAGGNGSNASGSTGGAGGVGSSTAISGGVTTGMGQLSSGSYYFAGGGGGGSRTGSAVSGGVGGGGAGGVGSSAGTAGTMNFGGGGGGGGGSLSVNSGNGGNGGSGIVIIKYAV